ncbi:MAG: lipoyl synthase [Leptospiraceae bacterium]|nr:lipoyl synthase [Leptospiraceae bacterium]
MNPLKKKPRTANHIEPPPAPNWMKKSIRFPLPDDPVLAVRNSLSERKLHTVCESASCPNLNHCWTQKTATYMLNGDICTRKCRYCDVASGRPLPLERDEPKNIAESARSLGLRYVVLTAVNRDDLEDGGAFGFAETIRELKEAIPRIRIEVLIPDFRNRDESLEIIFQSQPDIINHNIETVSSLFKEVAPQKNYKLSLEVLKKISEKGFPTKSGIIVGLGEEIEEVKECITDLYQSGVRLLTIGQYLQPTPTHFPVRRYYEVSEFDELREFAMNLGFTHVESGPLVRSSYHAEDQAKGI